jgi:hypothetical protein
MLAAAVAAALLAASFPAAPVCASAGASSGRAASAAGQAAPAGQAAQYSLVPKITVRGPAELDLAITITNAAPRALDYFSDADDIHWEMSEMLVYYLSQDSTISFNKDVLLGADYEITELEAGRSVRFGDYCGEKLGEMMMVTVPDAYEIWSHMVSFSPLTDYEMLTAPVPDGFPLEPLGLFPLDDLRYAQPAALALAGGTRRLAEIADFGSYPSNEARKVERTIYTMGDGTVVDVRRSSSAAQVRTFDKSGNLKASKTIPAELEFCGAFFHGETYNYMAFIEYAHSEDDNFEVIRIVKYDASFNRLGAASVYAGEAYTMSASTHGRFAERGGELAYHTSRTRYVTADGLHHQSNLTVLLDSGPMAVKYVSEQFPANHVSHSFDQYVLYDGGTPVYLDHGDGSPRAVVVNKPVNGLARGGGSGSWGGGAPYEGYMLKYIGPSGANYTGVSVGGFQMSDTSYLTAVSTIDHSKIHSWLRPPDSVLDSGTRPSNEDEVEWRNIVVCALPRNFANEGEAERVTLGSYWGTGRTASTPQLLPNGDGTFTVAWAVHSGGKRESFVAQAIDGRGRPVGALRSYAGSEEFYCDYLGIDALPGAVPATEAAAAATAETAHKWTQVGASGHRRAQMQAEGETKNESE